MLCGFHGNMTDSNHMVTASRKELDFILMRNEYFHKSCIRRCKNSFGSCMYDTTYIQSFLL